MNFMKKLVSNNSRLIDSYQKERFEDLQVDKTQL